MLSSLYGPSIRQQALPSQDFLRHVMDQGGVTARLRPPDGEE